MINLSTNVLCLNPLVVVIDDVFDQALADEIIAVGQSNLVRAEVVDRTGGSKADESRTNENGRIQQWSHDNLAALVTKIAGLVRLPPENSEPVTLLKYQGEQRFDPHTDAFDNSTGGREFLAQGGQRLFTTICYLNDVPKGGETEFPALKLSIKPKLGRVLVFGNTRLGTALEHPHSTHAGRPVQEGEKYALSIWWRQLAYHVQRDYPAESGEIKVID